MTRKLLTGTAVVVEMHTPAGRVASYSMIGGVASGVSFIASDQAMASARMGQTVRVTFHPDDQFARLAKDQP